METDFGLVSEAARMQKVTRAKEAARHRDKSFPLPTRQRW
jgi:predicted RNA polymerase sigma factor